jgi:hypothetical protein
VFRLFDSSCAAFSDSILDDAGLISNLFYFFGFEISNFQLSIFNEKILCIGYYC